MIRAIRAILTGFLVLAASPCLAQEDWSYPVDPYFGVLHPSEYPADEFPVDVNFMPKTVATATPVRMGDPDKDWTYWPTPTYYWWDALTGPGVLHGAWQSTAMARDVHECPPEFCTQTYSPDDAGGNIEFVFGGTTQNIRIRLVRFDGEQDVGGFRIGSYWREGQSRVPTDAFFLEYGTESESCAVYESPASETLVPCKVYQAVIPPVANSTNVLYGKCHRGHCNVLKVSSTMDPVTYYPDEVTAGSDPGPTPEPVAANNAPVVATALTDMTITEAKPVSHTVAANFTDADDDPLTFAATGLPGSLRIDAMSGLISGIPTASEAGRLFPVTVTATDPAAESASGSFTISVTAAPKPVQPVAAVTSSGGGGSLGPAALFLLAVMRVRWSRRIRTTRRADARPRAIGPA